MIEELKKGTQTWSLVCFLPPWFVLQLYFILVLDTYYIILYKQNKMLHVSVPYIKYRHRFNTIIYLVLFYLR